MNSAAAKSFRIAGLLEALSWIALIGAMYFKYSEGEATATRVPGSIHGFLFITYVSLAAVLNGEQAWTRKKLWAALGLSIVPFGTLVFDRMYLAKSER